MSSALTEKTSNYAARRSYLVSQPNALAIIVFLVKEVEQKFLHSGSHSVADSLQLSPVDVGRRNGVSSIDFKSLNLEDLDCI